MSCARFLISPVDPMLATSFFFALVLPASFASNVPLFWTYFLTSSWGGGLFIVLGVGCLLS